MVTYEELKQNEDIRTYIIRADESLQAMGYTEHSFAHVCRVAETAAYILETLGYSAHEIELAKISGYLHDIGNVINRIDHSQSGAMMAFRLLDHLHFSAEDTSLIVTAIGNHDEGSGVAVNAVAAAMILGDKADVRRSRVRNTDRSTFDIHDRVNYSVVHSELTVSEDKTRITLALQVDTAISPVMEYFQIFLNRMIMCRGAAEKLGLRFQLIINGQSLM